MYGEDCDEIFLEVIHKTKIKDSAIAVATLNMRSFWVGKKSVKEHAIFMFLLGASLTSIVCL